MISHKDRLLWFSSELVFSSVSTSEWKCDHKASEDSSFEEDLAQDVIEIATVFSARLYGSKSHKNKKVMESFSPLQPR